MFFEKGKIYWDRKTKVWFLALEVRQPNIFDYHVLRLSENGYIFWWTFNVSNHHYVEIK
jgi:hypothetical protein